MNITGIITEYNPFHNGHLYHLQKTKEITSAQGVVCVMNGSFMQRGEPAFTDKWSRTSMALKQGVDLVIELPLNYGIRSAEYFAEGAVKTLAATGVVSSFVFGSESGNINPLREAAKIFNREPAGFKKTLQSNLKQGYSFPAARQQALLEYIKNRDISSRELKEAVSEPNNILGIEYIKAVLKNNLNLIPHTIKRTHKNYYSRDMTHEMAGATAIRHKIRQSQNPESIKKFVPETTYEQLCCDFKKNKIPLKKEKLGTMILAELRKKTPSELTQYAEVKEGLENRIHNAARQAGDYQELIKKITTRVYPKTRVKRNLLHILLGLTKNDFDKMSSWGIPYLRILGFSECGARILSQIDKRSSREIITQPADYLKSIKLNSRNPLKKQLSYDLLATDIYALLYKSPENRTAGLDFIKQIITF